MGGRYRHQKYASGYLERFESLQNFIANYDKSNELKDFEPYKWKWIYDRKLNILIFPHKKSNLLIFHCIFAKLFLCLQINYEHKSGQKGLNLRADVLK